MSKRSCVLCAVTVENYLDNHPDFIQRYYFTRIMDSQNENVEERRKPVKLLQGDQRSAEPCLQTVLGTGTTSSTTTTKVNNEFGSEEGSFVDEKDLLMEFIRDISNELDVQRLSHKILVNVGILTNADRCSLFLVQRNQNKRILVSELFDVTSESSLQESLQDDKIIVEFGVGIAGHTAQTGDTINIKNAYQDPRFNSAIDKKTGYKTHSIVCMPIKNYEGQVVGVAQVINKKTSDHEFTERDVEVVKNFLTFCGIGITNAQLFQLSVMEYKRNQILLQLAKRIFEEQTNLDNVIRNIMLESRELWHCKTCSVFLVDTTIENDIAFLQSFNLLPEENKVICEKDSAYNEIAYFSARTGQTLNIIDVYEDDRFCDGIKESDVNTGLRTKSILCTPIKRNQKIIGVCQLINKIDKHPFDENDESLFEAFAIFCGIGIHNTSMYEQTSKLLAKQMVAMEVLSYHARAAPDDIDRLLLQPIPEAAKFCLYDFSFNDSKLNDDETILASIRMFRDLTILNSFNIPLKTLVSWLLSVKKNYRPVLYHNWRHAFNVAQTMFSILTTGKMKNIFTKLEIFALLVACLCHDLDHRGTNNTFQSKIESPLARLYGTSTMEHHHFDHCIMILNSEGNNIFSELLPDEYRSAIEILEHAILSTDLQVYFKKRSVFKTIVESSSPPNWQENDKNRTVLRAMMMTACDVSAITKPWPIQQAIAKLVASEFFEQGDIERTQLNSKPMPMMDREKIDDLPKMQVGFIDSICSPIYELMEKVEPSLSPLYHGVQENRKKWESLQTENTDSEKSSEARVEYSNKNNNDQDIMSGSKNKRKKEKTTSSKTCTIL